MSSNSDKVVISSSVFIVSFMALDAILSDNTDELPKLAVQGLVLVTMLSSFEFIGLGRIAAPMASLIAGSVFLTRGARIFSRLVELSDTQVDEQESDLRMGTKRQS